MNDVFKINTKIKPLVKIPDFTFIDYHNLQQSVCYYIRKYDDHNDFDFMEAKIVKTGNKVKDRYTLGSGTSIKILDSFLVESFFTGKERNMKAIEELIQERENRLKDLERFAGSYNIDYKKYYNPMIYSDLNRMVG